MTVHVDSVSSEVTTESVPEAAGGSAGDTAWQELDRMRALREEMDRDRARTRAEGFDD